MQDRSIRFSLSGGKIRGMKVGFKVTCPSGTVDTDALALHGTFLVSRGRTQNWGTGTVSGKFITPRLARGTLRLRPVNVTDGVGGGNTERCDGGLLRWTAHAS